MPKTHFEVLFVFCLFNAEDSPGSSVIELGPLLPGHWFSPGWEIKITQAMWHNKKTE